VSETLLATIARDQLSVALTHFHRSGYGHVIKVMDPDRAPLADQLRRAGVESASIHRDRSSSHVLLFVPAPERSRQAAVIAHSVGADAIEIVHAGDPITWSLPGALQGEAERRQHRRRPVPAPQPTLHLAD
jgi:hypothetical protein